MRRYERTPAELLRDTTMTLQARAVYPLIRDLIWEQNGATGDEIAGDLPALHQLAVVAGCSITALKGYLKELRDAGWVETYRAARGKPQHYRVFGQPRESESAPRVSRNTAHSRARDPYPDLEPDNNVGAKAPTLAERPKPRARNLVFDALVEATHANPADGGMIAKAGKSIRIAMADHITDLTHAYMAANPSADEVPAKAIDEMLAGEIVKRARMYAELRPDWELTPTSLAKHWNRIPTWTSKRGDGLSPSEIARLDL